MDRQGRTVLLLAAVMAVNAADSGVIGAVVDQLRHSLHIGNTQVGLLTAMPAVVGAIATLPVGQLADRMPRVPLLAGSIALWSGAMIAGGLATTYLWLLASRIALGAVTATAGPTVASLTGDLFEAGKRAQIYGHILAGEMLGVGFGLLAGGDLAAVLSWRASFWFIALLGGLLAVAVARFLPEPPRGRTTHLGTVAREAQGDVTHAAVKRRHIRPEPRSILRGDPEHLPLGKAFEYVLRIRTNVMIIIASAIGYLFFAGLRTFTLVFVEERYGVSKLELTALVPIIGLGAVAGVLGGGRLADVLTRRGWISARVTVPGGAYAVAALLFLPGLLTHEVLVAIPLFTLGAAALAAANPPLDAARLDIVHFQLWGRAESVRTILRLGGEATGPVLFGWLSQQFSGSSRSAIGLDRTFMIGLVPLVVNGLLLMQARRTYPGDVAAATVSEHGGTVTEGGTVSERRTAQSEPPPGPPSDAPSESAGGSSEPFSP